MCLGWVNITRIKIRHFTGDALAERNPDEDMPTGTISSGEVDKPDPKVNFCPSIRVQNRST